MWPCEAIPVMCHQYLETCSVSRLFSSHLYRSVIFHAPNPPPHSGLPSSCHYWRNLGNINLIPIGKPLCLQMYCSIQLFTLTPPVIEMDRHQGAGAAALGPARTGCDEQHGTRRFSTCSRSRVTSWTTHGCTSAIFSHLRHRSGWEFVKAVILQNTQKKFCCENMVTRTQSILQIFHPSFHPCVWPGMQHALQVTEPKGIGGPVGRAIGGWMASGRPQDPGHQKSQLAEELIIT